jgi:hypothetical protein
MRDCRPNLLLTGVLVGLALTGCRNLGVVSASYSTLQEARQAGAIARGWVPEGLPPGTRDIREAHDIDSNRRWGLFSFPVEEADYIRRMLRQEEFPLSGVGCDIPGRLEWWPVLLRGTLNAESIEATGLRSYRAAAVDLIVVVNWNQGRAYYWSPEPR